MYSYFLLVVMVVSLYLDAKLSSHHPLHPIPRSVLLGVAMFIGFFTLSPKDFFILYWVLPTLFLMFPQILVFRSVVCLLRGNYARAEKLFKIACFFWPVPSVFRDYRFHKALSRMNKGDNNQVLQILDVLHYQVPPLSQFPTALLALLEGKYQTVLNAISLENCKKDPILRPLRWQALGELGQLNLLIEEMAELSPKLRSIYSPPDGYAVLMLAAYTGHQELWDLMSNRHFKKMNDFQKHFWTATFLYVKQGERARYEDELKALLPHSSYWEARLIHLRLESAFVTPLSAPLSEELRQKLDSVLRHSASMASFFQTQNRRFPWVSVLLLLANLAIQILVLAQGHGFSSKTLYQYGAIIVPIDLDHGLWWRVLTACFVHANWAHFLMNMSVFIYFPFAEKHLGHWRFLLIYLLAGLGGFALTFWIWSYFQLMPKVDMVLGASGAICGILGAWTVLAFRSWRDSDFKIAKRLFWCLVASVLLQMVCDFFLLGGTLGSLWFHFLGFMVGLTTTFMLYDWDYTWAKSVFRKTGVMLGLWIVLAVSIMGVSLYNQVHRPAVSAKTMASSGYLAFLAGNSKEALQWYLKGAKAGGSYAQWLLGNEYYLGRMVTKNVTLAEYWWKKAAFQGDLYAMFSLSALAEERHQWETALRWKRAVLPALYRRRDRDKLMQEIRGLENKIEKQRTGK